jgi:hypothetical protein
VVVAARIGFNVDTTRISFNGDAVRCGSTAVAAHLVTTRGGAGRPRREAVRGMTFSSSDNAASSSFPSSPSYSRDQGHDMTFLPPLLSDTAFLDMLTTYPDLIVVFSWT